MFEWEDATDVAINIINEYRNRIRYMNCEEDGYICTCCGDYCFRSDSYSYQGYNWHCAACYFKLRRKLEDDNPDNINNALDSIHERGIRIKALLEDNTYMKEEE